MKEKRKLKEYKELNRYYLTKELIVEGKIMIRKYKKHDRKAMEKLDEFGIIEITYHGDVIKDEIYVYEDEKVKEGENIIGLLYFKYHFTWYGEKEAFHRIQPCYVANDEEVKRQLITFSKEWFRIQKKKNKDKSIALVQWLYISQANQIQKLCKDGFFCYELCPTYEFSLLKKNISWKLQTGFSIEELAFNEEQINAYIDATKIAHDGTADSIAELWFRTGGPGGIKVYQLKQGNTIVSAASTWHIHKTRAAIENIFSNPDYRNNGYAKTIIAYTLNKIRENGYETATLSCSGHNFKAQKLYKSLGFEQIDMQVEMLFA